MYPTSHASLGGISVLRWTVALVALLLALGGFVALPASAETTLDDSPPLVPHGPILIDGDMNWTAANGVTGGNGSYSNPWTIEGWDISAASGTGITIRGTIGMFLIRRVSVHSGSEPGVRYYDGIHLDQVSNGRIQESLLRSNFNGISMLVSTNIAIERNDISQNDGSGVAASLSRSITIKGNLVSNSQTGVALGETLYSEVSDNRLIGNDGSGITISGEQYRPSASVYVARNDIADSSSGILLFGAISVNIIQNRIRDSGLYGFGAIESRDGEYLTVVWNDFIGNFRDAYVSGTRNVTWYTGYSYSHDFWSGGNFWSRYAGEDRCSGPDQNVCPDFDGIGDTPYTLFSWDYLPPGVDRYPQMSHQFPADAPINTPPVPLFSATPSQGVSPLNVTVDASAAWDLQEPTAGLEVRWDWEGDGLWDTPWSNAKVAHHLYEGTGSYSVQLEVRDSAGLNASAVKALSVAGASSTGPFPWGWTATAVASLGVAAAAAFVIARRRRRQTPP